MSIIQVNGVHSSTGLIRKPKMCNFFVFFLELQCQRNPDHIDHHKLLQVIGVQTWVLSVDPAVACKLAPASLSMVWELLRTRN